ncbi:MAG: NAD(P)/FAD-dependent oxidoreductase [Oscillospiraceae bacterium]|nr:NAD(P)/FAD-dependent oxidoreductase [Oscillospiraceae bacterium]
MDRVDIAIIGSGPAGVSAAITAKTRNRSVVLFGTSALSPKLEKAHKILNYAGLPEVSGAELAERLREHLRVMDIPVTEEQATAVYAMGKYFAVETASGMTEASAVILATGVFGGKPIPGEEEFLGRGVSTCATCDGNFYKGKTIAVLGFGAEAPKETEYLASLVAKVYYFPAAGRELEDPPANVETIAAKTAAISGEGKAERVETDAGEYAVDGVFVLRDAVPADRLVPGLKMDGPHAEVDLRMRTNLPGCFACGDLAGTPYQYIKAAGQGNVAALSAAEYLASLG